MVQDFPATIQFNHCYGCQNVKNQMTHLQEDVGTTRFQSGRKKNITSPDWELLMIMLTAKLWASQIKGKKISMWW